jgi:hypothetical protein
MPVPKPPASSDDHWYSNIDWGTVVFVGVTAVGVVLVTTGAGAPVGSTLIVIGIGGIGIQGGSAYAGNPSPNPEPSQIPGPYNILPPPDPLDIRNAFRKKPGT